VFLMKLILLMKKQSIQFGKTKKESFGFGTLEELIATEWFQTRPAFIQEMILDYPPITLYKFKDGRVVHMYSYCEDKTVSVVHLGYGSEFAILSKGFRVFGIKPKKLIMLTQEESRNILTKVEKLNQLQPN